jgi:DNA (cytosine-5)-methyltransferase 1
MRVVDLFSGCGGLSLGFQRAGYTIVRAIDNWEPAIATYKRNFNHMVECAEIGSSLHLPKCDVIVGGPPCQGFSSAGMRRETDNRSTLVGVFAKIVARELPRAFVFENVEGFITTESGEFLFDLLRPTLEAGYRIHLRKVNASNFGVPQHRKRIIAIGGLGWDPTFPDETHQSFGAPGADFKAMIEMPSAPTLDLALEGLPAAKSANDGERHDELDHIFSPFSKTDQLRASMLEAGQRMRDLPEELWHESYRRRANRRVSDGTPTERRGGAPNGLRRLSAKEPSKAITGGALREFVHPSEDRPLTIRECARLQTFPDEFIFEGKVSEKIQQIGNAVPPLLATVIARQLLVDLQEKGIGTKSTEKGKLLSFTPTRSDGKSPVLQKVINRVSFEFMNYRPPMQEELCL